jgi:hypothetical protein
LTGELGSHPKAGAALQEIEAPTMREIRYVDRLLDELAEGRAMKKILWEPKVDRTISRSS